MRKNPRNLTRDCQRLVNGGSVLLRPRLRRKQFLLADEDERMTKLRLTLEVPSRRRDEHAFGSVRGA